MGHPMDRPTATGKSHELPHLASLKNKLSILVSECQGSSHGSSYHVPQTKKRAWRLSNGRGWPHWTALFCSNLIFHTFNIQNLSEHYQILLNEFKSIWYFQKTSKKASTCRNINFVTLDGVFQAQYFGLSEILLKYSLKIRNSLVVLSNDLWSSKSILRATAGSHKIWNRLHDDQPSINFGWFIWGCHPDRL